MPGSHASAARNGWLPGHLCSPVALVVMRWRKFLGPGEEVLVDTRPHWWFLAGPLSVAIVGIVGGIAAKMERVPSVVDWLVAGLVVIAALWLGLRYLRWVSTRLIVTNSRVVERRGLLARSGREIPVSAISNVAYHQSLLGRVVGAGDIAVESPGRDSAEVFRDLPHPEAIQNLLYIQLATWRSAGTYGPLGQAGAPAGPAWTPPGGKGVDPSGPGTDPAGRASIPAQIDQLDQLRRRGVITDAEFQAKKTQLLERM